MEPEEEENLPSPSEQDEIAELFRKNRALRGERLEIKQKAREVIRKLKAEKPMRPLN